MLLLSTLLFFLVFKAESTFLPFLNIESRSTVNTLWQCDDCAIPVYTPTNVNFYNLTFDSVYISSNGLFSFGRSYSDFVPRPFPLSDQYHVVAPFWDDIDLSSGFGTLVYELLTRDNATSIVDDVNAYISSHESTSFNADWILVAKWIDVCPYGDASCTNHQPNSFQGLIAIQGSLTYAVFTYRCNFLRWTRHSASIGYSAGPNFFANHPLSNTDNVTDIDCINQPNSIWSNIVYRISQEFIQVTAVSDVVVALNGTDVVLTCDASGYPTPIDIQWIFNNVSITNDSVKYAVDSESGTLTITNGMINDAGIYTCIAINSFGSSNATINVSIQVPPVFINVPPMNITSVLGGNITIECTAIGKPQPTIVWQKNGQLLRNTSRLRIHSITTDSSIHSILQTTSTLMVKDLRVSDSGSYSCKADNDVDIGVVVVTPFVIQVIEPPPINYCANSPCLNNGNCTNLTETFSCRCTADFTGLTCAERVITPYPPLIVQGPINTPGKLYSSLSLTCIATGVPFPTIKWYKDNNLISNNNDDPSVLVISEINLNDRGFYHCRAMNTINGVDNIVTSPKALVNITDVVQYEAHIILPNDFYTSLNDTDDNNITPRNEVFDLISQSNNYLAGSGVSNVSNASFFFLEILNSDSINYTAKPKTLPIVVTVVTERPSDEQLKLGITQQLSVVSQRLTVNISIIEVDRFDGCRSNHTIIPSHSSRMELDLTISWPETYIGGTAVVNCPCGSDGTSGDEIQLTASRYCGGDFNNGAVWSNPDVLRCNFSDLAREICRLRNLPVFEKVEQLENLTSNADLLGSTEIAASVSVLTTATEQVSGNVTLTTTFLEVIDNILVVDTETLQESQQESNTSAKLLEAIESVVEEIIVDTSEPVIITQRSFAVSVQQVNSTDFSQNGQIFSVNLGNISMQLNTDNLMLGETSDMPPTGSISLPNNLLDLLVDTNNSKITNAVYTTDSLFLRREQKSLEVGSIILAATVVGNVNITDLDPPITLNFQILPIPNSRSPLCTFWDQTLDDGYGGWSTEGCRTIINNDTSTVTCECNHLTNFAILLDVSPVFNPTTPFSLFLDAVTYIGLIASIVCLIITVISYLGSKKLRTADHGQLLLNLCFALMGLYISFIIAVHGIHSRGFCAFAGALLQYFFLVTFMTMAAEAVNLYMTLVIVLGRKIQRYVLKAIIACWVTPIFVVLFCFAPSYENYISEHFCRAFEAPFYIGTVIPFIVIYIFNWVVFAIIIITLIRRAINSNMKKIKSETEKNVATFVKQQLVIVLTLSFLFGLGWGVGLFATQGIYDNRTVRDIIAAIFILITAFHGIFVFIMHCIRSKEVRQIWKKWFFRITRKDFDDVTTSAYSRIRLMTFSKTSTLQTSVNSPSFYSPTTTGTSETAFAYFMEKSNIAGNSDTLRYYTEKKEKSMIESQIDPVSNNYENVAKAESEVEPVSNDYEKVATENQVEPVFNDYETVITEGPYESVMVETEEKPVNKESFTDQG